MSIFSLSIVTYETSILDLEKVYNSIKLCNLHWILFIVDNSPSDDLRSFAERDNRVRYIFNNCNLGFGAGHNIALKEAMDLGISHHFIVNPDIYFEKDIISPMIYFMKKDIKIGMIMPEVLHPDGTIQNLPKLLPSPLSIILRKLKRPKSYYKKFIQKYELRNIPRYKIYNAPILSGCFTLLNVDAIKDIGMYDDEFFMYFEDWDLSRRMTKNYKTIYFPQVSVYHGYDSGANKSAILFKIYIKSAIHYFNKWGWLFDKNREAINFLTLSQFK